MRLTWHISDDYGAMNEDVFLVDRENRTYGQIKDGVIFMTPYEQGTASIKPLFSMYNSRVDDWKSALLQALTTAGAQPIEKKYLEGKLEATTNHLEDMRKLVFNGKKV